MAHHIHPPQEIGPGGGIAYVKSVRASWWTVTAMGLRDHHVDAHDLMAPDLELVADRCSDETSRAGQQDPHGMS